MPLSFRVDAEGDCGYRAGKYLSLPITRCALSLAFMLLSCLIVAGCMKARLITTRFELQDVNGQATLLLPDINVTATVTDVAIMNNQTAAGQIIVSGSATSSSTSWCGPVHYSVQYQNEVCQIVLCGNRIELRNAGRDVTCNGVPEPRDAGGHCRISIQKK